LPADATSNYVRSTICFLMTEGMSSKTTGNRPCVL